MNGELYSGTNGMAGEAGHIRLAEDGPVGYGKEGSFEGFCSGGGIAQLGQVMAGEALDLSLIHIFCVMTDLLDCRKIFCERNII